MRNPDVASRTIDFVYFNGPLLCGKSEQASRLRALAPHRIRELSGGDIIRGSVSEKDEFGRFKALLDPYRGSSADGKLAPTREIKFALETLANEYIAEGATLLIFNGYPRSLEQIDPSKEFAQNVRDRRYNVREQHLELSITLEEAFSRRHGRIEDALQRGIRPREDDTEEKLKNRFAVYAHETEPMLVHLRRTEDVIWIDGSGSKLEVHASIVDALKRKGILSGQVTSEDAYLRFLRQPQSGLYTPQRPGLSQ